MVSLRFRTEEAKKAILEGSKMNQRPLSEKMLEQFDSVILNEAEGVKQHTAKKSAPGGSDEEGGGEEEEEKKSEEKQAGAKN